MRTEMKGTSCAKQFLLDAKPPLICILFTSKMVNLFISITKSCISASLNYLYVIGVINEAECSLFVDELSFLKFWT